MGMSNSRLNTKLYVFFLCFCFFRSRNFITQDGFKNVASLQVHTTDKTQYYTGVPYKTQYILVFHVKHNTTVLCLSLIGKQVEHEIKGAAFSSTGICILAEGTVSVLASGASDLVHSTGLEIKTSPQY